jgi:hypothetical protein
MNREHHRFVDLGEQEGNISNTIPEFGPAGGHGYPASSVPHNAPISYILN